MLSLNQVLIQQQQQRNTLLLLQQPLLQPIVILKALILQQQQASQILQPPCRHETNKDTASLLSMLGSPQRDASLEFVDVLRLEGIQDFQTTPKPTRGGVTEAFSVQESPHTPQIGRLDPYLVAPRSGPFLVRDHERLATVLSRFYKQSHWSSFRR